MLSLKTDNSRKALVFISSKFLHPTLNSFYSISFQQNAELTWYEKSAQQDDGRNNTDNHCHSNDNVGCLHHKK